MLLIPAGNPHAPSQRIPWITLAIVGVCLAAFALTGFGTWNTPVKAAERNEEALRYFMEHPYLTLRPEAERTLLGDDPAINKQVIGQLKAKHPAPDAATTAHQQVALDRLLAGAFNDPAVDPFQRFALVPARPQAVAWVTHLFLHPGWGLLLGNLLLLFLIAPFLEELWGRPVFLGFYLLSGIVAAGAFLLTNRGAETPLAGASGAIAACMGALAAHYRISNLPFFYWVAVRQGFAFVPTWLLLGIWAASQIAVVRAEGATAAVTTLVAGFAFGGLAGFGLSLGRAEPRPSRRAAAAPAASNAKSARPAAPPAPPAPNREVLARARAAKEEGDLEIAISLLREHLAEHPGDPETVLALWEAAVARGSAADVAPAMKGLVRAELRDGLLEQAATHWVELIRVAPTMTLETGSLLKMVAPLVAAHRKDDALAVLRRALLTAGTNLPAATAVRIAILAADLDPRLARSVLQLVLSRQGLDPTERQQAEKVLAALPVIAPAEAPAAPTAPA